MLGKSDWLILHRFDACTLGHSNIRVIHTGVPSLLSWKSRIKGSLIVIGPREARGRVVVVGAGPAGTLAAIYMAKLNYIVDVSFSSVMICAVWMILQEIPTTTANPQSKIACCRSMSSEQCRTQ